MPQDCKWWWWVNYRQLTSISVCIPAHIIQKESSLPLKSISQGVQSSEWRVNRIQIYSDNMTSIMLSWRHEGHWLVGKSLATFKLILLRLHLICKTSERGRVKRSTVQCSCWSIYCNWSSLNKCGVQGALLEKPSKNTQTLEWTCKLAIRSRSQQPRLEF